MMVLTRRLWTVAAVVLLAAAISVVGQVTLDGTLGPGGALTGPYYNIPSSVGRTVGNNLFQSFRQFNLTEGEKATFTGPDNIANVISRVTGRQASSIDGTIECNIPGANFFFINPFGINFGQHAQLNVGGSFVATTADYIKLADGGRFDTHNPGNDILTAAPVSAFGFLGPTVSPIQVNGPSIDQPSSLLDQIGEGKTFALIGGDIQIRNTQLSAPDGCIALVSVASAGELAFDVEGLSSSIDTLPFAKLGNIELTDGTFLDVSGNRGGRISLTANDVTLANSTALYAISYDTGDGLGIDISARESINVLQSVLYTITAGSGEGGNITLTAPLVRLDGQGSGATIGSDGAGEGRAGNIEIAAETVEILNSASIGATTSGTGDGGDIRITASIVLLDGYGLGARIGAEALPGAGKAGGVFITVDSLTLNSFAVISSATSDSFEGGNIVIRAGSLSMTHDSLISATTFAEGRGGNIEVTANLVMLNRVGSTGSDFGIVAGTAGTGNGGDVSVAAGTFELSNGASVLASSFDVGSGNAGNVNVEATMVTLSGGSSVESAAIGAGKGGNVTIAADDTVLIRDGSRVSVSAAQNDGGEIHVTAGIKVRLDHGLISAQAAGNGGNVFITAPSLVYLLNSRITAESMNGNGGNIMIDPLFVILNRSKLVASAIQGNGGSVNISADYFLRSDSIINVSSEFGLQGSVTITAPDLDLSTDEQPLEAQLLDPTFLLQPFCAERAPAGISSLFVRESTSRQARPGLLMPIIPNAGDGK